MNSLNYEFSHLCKDIDNIPLNDLQWLDLTLNVQGQNHLSLTRANIMVADALASWAARTSAAMILTL